jgi:hypothetical protein
MPTSCWTEVHYTLFGLCEAEIAELATRRAAGPGRSRVVKRGDVDTFERTLEALRKRSRG